MASKEWRDIELWFDGMHHTHPLRKLAAAMIMRVLDRGQVPISWNWLQDKLEEAEDGRRL